VGPKNKSCLVAMFYVLLLVFELQSQIRMFKTCFLKTHPYQFLVFK